GRSFPPRPMVGEARMPLRSRARALSELIVHFAGALTARSRVRPARSPLGQPAPAAVDEIGNIRIPDPGPFGETPFEARVRVMVRDRTQCSASGVCGRPSEGGSRGGQETELPLDRLNA